MSRTDPIASVVSARARRLTLFTLCIHLLLNGITAAQQRRSPRPSVTTEVSLVAAKRLEAARDFVVREQWDEALDALDELSADFGDALIEVESGRFLNVHDVGQATIAGMPPPGLAEYRSRVDGAAEFLYAEGLRQDDPDSMRQLLRTSFASSYGDDALWWLAEDAWACGDLDRARLFWTQLVPLSKSSTSAPPLILRYPDSTIPQPDILARLVLCSIMEGEFVAARNELSAFRMLYPTEVGRLAGRAGVLCDILEEVLASAGPWSVNRTTLECRTFACYPGRNAVMPALPPVLRLLWRTDLAGTGSHPKDGRRPPRSSGVFPVVWNGTALIQDDAGIRALALSDGRPAWPGGRTNDRGVIHQTPGISSIEFPSVGISRHSGTVANGHYYARVGPALLAPATASLRQIEDRLVALDLQSGEGRLSWDITTDELLAEEGWRFTGAPLVVGERLYVTVRRTAFQVELAVACLHADSARLIWRQSVGIDLESPPEHQHRVGHELLTYATGTLYFANQAGLLVALESESGRLNWIASYPSYPLSSDELSHPAHAGLLPPVFHRGTLYLAPWDASHVMAIDAATGVLRWQTRKPGRISALLGVTGNMLIAGGDRLWRIAADTGRLHPPFGYDDPAGYGSGRGAIAGSSVYWTTRDELFEVDLASGQALRRWPLEMLGLSEGGNLVIVDDCLLFAEPHQLTVFSAGW